jgi:cellulose synthase/poly-beta-1,6-N-acetylglucosamine synthase-like glycosyltransferase
MISWQSKVVSRSFLEALQLNSPNNMPGASIIIPTHNRPHLLPRVVESARAAGTDVEIIVVDDASIDETVMIMEQPVGVYRRPTLLWNAAKQLPERAFGFAAANILTALRLNPLRAFRASVARKLVGRMAHN